MRYPAQIMICGNTQKSGLDLVFYNRFSNINGRQRAQCGVFCYRFEKYKIMSEVRLHLVADTIAN